MVPLDESAIRAPLSDFLATALELPAADAELTVDHFIRAEQMGKHDHGLVRVDYLVRSGKFGPYQYQPAPAPQIKAPGHIHVDGQRHLGYPVLRNLIEAGCRQACQQGICVGTSVSVYPSGALGDWAHLAISRGIGVVLMASSPPRVAAPNGNQPLVGTNPICVGLPTDGAPFVADASTSAINHGELLLARSSGNALPPDSAITSGGKPTTDAGVVDPTKGLGALLSIGRSHKSFALALGIELLVALGGGAPGSDDTGQHGVFALFIGPSLVEEARPRASRWLRELAAGQTRVPGWVSFEAARAQQDNGVVCVCPETVIQLETLMGHALTVSTKENHEKDGHFSRTAC